MPSAHVQTSLNVSNLQRRYHATVPVSSFGKQGGRIGGEEARPAALARLKSRCLTSYCYKFVSLLQWLILMPLSLITDLYAGALVCHLAQLLTLQAIYKCSNGHRLCPIMNVGGLIRS